MKQDDLSKKIEKEIYKQRISNSSIEELVSKIEASETLTFFFNELVHKPNIKKLLFLHRIDLFGKNTEIHIPYFHLCTIPKNVKAGIARNQVGKTLHQIISNKIDGAELRGKNFVKNTLGIGDDISKDIPDILMYALIGFIRSNPNVISLINGKEFNYKIMKEMLGEFTPDKLNFSEYFSNLFQNYDDENVVDPVIVRKIESQILGLVSNAMSKIDKTIENFSNIAPDLTIALHRNAMIWISVLLSKVNLDFESYVEILEDLYRYKLVENKNIITWCESCCPEHPSYTTRVGKLSPNKLIKPGKCWSCGNKESFSSIYGLNEDLKEIIFSKDGIMAVYFSWLLKHKKIEHSTGKYAGQYETDILIKKSVLVESKLFKTIKDETSIQSSIAGALGQLQKQSNQFQTDGIKIEQAYLLWNKSFPVAMSGMIESQYSNFIKDKNFQIIGLNDIERFVQGL
jgi:hypothetical protein